MQPLELAADVSRLSFEFFQFLTLHTHKKKKRKNDQEDTRVFLAGLRERSK